MVAFGDSFSEIQDNTTKRERTYPDPCVPGIIGNRTDLSPHFPYKTLKESRLAGTDLADDRHSQSLGNLQVGLLDLDCYLSFLRLLEGT